MSNSNPEKNAIIDAPYTPNAKVRVIYTASEIHERVKALGAQISEDFAGQEIMFVANLKGAVVFLTDLLKFVSIPAKIDFIATSSWSGGTESMGRVRIVKDFKEDIHGKNIILIEDIVDTGLTLSFLYKYLELHGIKSLSTCSLLDKPSARQAADAPPIDYIGFEVPNIFLIGYGLDYNELYRGLPYLGELMLPEKAN